MLQASGHPAEGGGDEAGLPERSRMLASPRPPLPVVPALLEPVVRVCHSGTPVLKGHAVLYWSKTRQTRPSMNSFSRER
jgi:hypothetical protein